MSYFSSMVEQRCKQQRASAYPAVALRPSPSTRAASTRSQLRSCLGVVLVGSALGALLVLLLRRGDGGPWTLDPLHQGGDRGTAEAAAGPPGYDPQWWTGLPGMQATVVHQQSDGPAYVPGELRDARPALVSQAQLSRMLQQFAARARANAPADQQLFNHSSVGILVVAKQRQLLSTYVNLRVLREHLRCTLPVEVIWHGPTETPPEPLQKAVASLPGVRLVDSSKVALPEPFAALGLVSPLWRQ